MVPLSSKNYYTPSSVDLNTQFAQQYQGPFVGLIISCFNNDNTNTNKINLIAFQTKVENGANYALYIDIDFGLFFVLAANIISYFIVFPTLDSFSELKLL